MHQYLHQDEPQSHHLWRFSKLRIYIWRYDCTHLTFHNTLFWTFGHVSKTTVMASALLVTFLYPVAVTTLFALFDGWPPCRQIAGLLRILWLRAALDILCAH